MTDSKSSAVAAELAQAQLDATLNANPAAAPERPALSDDARALVEAVGAADAESAVALIRANAAVASKANELAARLAEAEAKLDASEREAVLAQARRDGKLTPGMESDKDFQRDVLKGMSLAQIKTYFKHAPAQVSRVKTAEPRKDNAKRDGDDAKAAVETESLFAALEAGDRKWSTLNNTDKASLFRDNAERAKRLQTAASAR